MNSKRCDQISDSEQNWGVGVGGKVAELPINRTSQPQVNVESKKAQNEHAKEWMKSWVTCIVDDYIKECLEPKGMARP